jgi:lipopolysaccharide/colanic/teichoic acid biosynthesis glycosyltransferase
MRPRKRRLLILGRSPLALALLRELAGRAHRYEVVGLAGDASLKRLVDEQHVERVVVAVRERRGRLPLADLLDCWIRGIHVESAEEFYERLTGRVPIGHLTPGNLIFHGAMAPAGWHARVSRIVSLLVAASGLALSWPVLALIAVLIKLESPGPALFVQERIGLGGRPFRLVKFRTMRESGGTGSEWVRDNGHRITRVGRLLRKFRLDELPQFWNILRGEMNLVGPRPHPAQNLILLVSVARNVAECGALIPYYSLRTRVRPGLTGWAQVRYGYANDLREEMEKLTYDLYYVKHRSLWLDLRIVLETIRLVLGGRKSEEADSVGVWDALVAEDPAELEASSRQ